MTYLNASPNVTDHFDFTDGDISWGHLTACAITEPDFAQGPDASDPSGDGHVPGTADEPRDSIAHVAEQGNIDATTDPIADLLGLG